jgi:carboxyl-terminal processing protease
VSKATLLLLLAFALPLPFGAPRAEPFGAAPSLNQPMLAGVTATALAFMAPRTLEAIPVPQLVLWGLRGLTTLDPRLTPELIEAPRPPATLRLLGAGKLLFARPAPPPTDIAAWADAASQMARAAWDSSDLIRQAGTQGLISSFFDELFNHLDPYSRYTPPAEATRDRIRRSGRATLGLKLTAQNSGYTIASVQAGGPAAQAGLRPGERLLQIDGQAVQGVSATAINAMLDGPDGTGVVLTLRGRDGASREAALVRATLPPETVFAKITDNLLILRISGFAASTASRIAQELILATSAPHPPLGVVIDLRGNRGGLLRQAAAAAAMLQPSGIVVTTAGRDPNAEHAFSADGRDLAAGLPVVVVVDGRTASAAEIFAAALADHRRAVLVGSATLGKGLVQTVAELPDGGELLVTWSRVLAPRGWPIQALGLLPQVCTSLGQDALNRQLRALAQGIQPMAAPLLRHQQVRPPLSPAVALTIRATCPAAEGRDIDLHAARFLIETPRAYATALLPPMPAPQPPSPPITAQPTRARP